MSEPYSVVIPAYNAEHTIGEAIASVLAQTVIPHEVIVVDDGSSDGTRDEVYRADSRVRLIEQKNAGPGAASTAGLAAVNTGLVAMLDADDLWVPEKADRQIARLRSEPVLDGVFCLARHFHPPRPPGSEGRVQEVWGRTAMMAWTDRIRQVGPIADMTHRHGDMVDWIMRAREQGIQFSMLSEILAYRRIHPDSLSFRRRDANLDYLSVIKRALDRKHDRSGQ